ncbi:MAG: matrixin family metalloprotease [Planctomycetota bacterium]|jgi:hypothetical protein
MLKSYLLPAIFLLCACGGGGGGSGDEPVSDAQIVTQSLEQGNVGLAYAQTLRATGGSGGFTWWISGSGDALPNGLALTSSGRLTGVPNEAATRSVVVVAQAADSSVATRTMLIETRDIAIEGAAGNVDFGETLSLTATGGSAGYSFSLTSNTSGATLSGGSYTAGSGNGVDVVRATDAQGFYDEVTVIVGQDPFIGFVARWGTSDVWHVEWDVVYDPTPTFASDLDESLVALGLRDAGSTGTVGSLEDDLARALVIRRTLGYLSTYYGNTFDGAAAPGGLAISFVKPSGPTVGSTPPPGGFQSAAPLRYSSICVRHGDTGNTVGTAWLDNGNIRVEHNCGSSDGLALGVFVNRLLGAFQGSFNSDIAHDPVGPGDVGGLQSMLLGDPPSDEREEEVFRAADDFARVLASVLAHEIGHSLGLDHAAPGSVQGDIMSASLTLGPSVSYTFSATDRTTLDTVLPGPNR